MTIKEIILGFLIWSVVGTTIGYTIHIIVGKHERVEVVNCTMKPCYLKVNGQAVTLKGGEVKFVGR